MAHRRDVSLSLIAVALGLVMGTGALTYLQQAPLEARTLSQPPATKYTTRKVLELGIPLRDESSTDTSFPTVKKSSSSAPAAPVTKSSSSCDAVRAALEKIKVTYDQVVPNNLKNTEMRKRMDFAFDVAQSDACAGVVASSSAAAVHPAAPSAAPVDNDCERWVKGTTQFLDCTRYEELGVRYY